MESLDKFWKHEQMSIEDNNENNRDRTMNIEFEKDNQRYEVSLPWKDNFFDYLSDNYEICKGRLFSLFRKLKESPELLRQYNEVFEQQLAEGIIEKLAIDGDKDSNAHFLCHFWVVRNDRQTTKLRVVFDGSAKSDTSLSLNDRLESGVNHMPLLFDTIVRFQMHPVVLIADIEKAFLQEQINPNDRDVLRFLWFDDITKEKHSIVQYRYCRLVFGLTCSPAILAETIQHHVSQFRSTYPLVASHLSKLYCDDFSYGAESDAHGQSISDEDDTSSGSNKGSPSTEVVEGTVEEEVFNQQQGIKRAHDLADIVLGKKSLTDLTDEEKYNYLKYHFKPSATEKLFSLKISKNGREKTLFYQHSWLEERSWHVYSPEMRGGLCKMCVLFDKPHKKAQRGAFVATAFQKLQRSELIKAHSEREYHKVAVAQGADFMRTFMQPETSVEADKTSGQYYQRNKHLLGAIVDAVLLCAKQGLPLRGHRDTKVNDVDEGTGNRGNFLAIIDLIAKYDPIVKEHLKNGQRNAKMLSWKTQNDIIANAALVIRNQIKDMICSEQFYAVI